MLKKRLIACLLIKDDILIQSIEFQKYLPIGKPKFTVEFVSRWDVDEIILLDISATPKKRIINLDMLGILSELSFVPMTVGGGIKNLDHVKKILSYGADKVSLNSHALEDKSIITQISETYGTQCIVISIDTKRTDDGEYYVYSKSGTKNHYIKAEDWAAECEMLGAGEILINSIDRDGMKNGYDIDLISMLTEKLNIPVVALGGVGNPSHFVEGITKGNADAVAAANIFLHSEHSTILAKSYLVSNDIDVRVDTDANYKMRSFDNIGRLITLDTDRLSEVEFVSQKGKYK